MIAHTQPPKRQLAIVFHADGPMAPTAVARRESRVRGVALATPNSSGVYFKAAELDQMNAMDSMPRVYDDALLGRTFELRCGIAQADEYDCLKTARHLLGRGDAPGRPPGSEQEAIVRAGELLVEYDRLAAELAAERLMDVYRGVEVPAISPTAAMILHGVLADRDGLASLYQQARSGLESAELDLARVAGRRINPSSYPEVSKYLFVELQLPIKSRTNKGNPAVNIETLEAIENRHPSVKALLQHARARKVSGRAGELLRAITPCTGRIHTDLDPLGATTGRFTSSHAALQNLPRELRSLIIAPPGHVLLEADYSQIELRVLAALSGEPKLLEAFRNPLTDLHRKTAAAIFGIDENAVQDGHRRVGKQVNFAVIYGETEHGLSRDLGISLSEAGQFIRNYGEAHPHVADWTRRIHDWVNQHGEVRTGYGRRRWLPDTRSTDPSRAAKARRQAVNTMVQGSAADILKIALARLHRELPPDVRVVLIVHDSVLLEVPIERVDEVRQQVTKSMETPPPGFPVPLRVDVGTGGTWADCKTRHPPLRPKQLVLVASDTVA